MLPCPTRHNREAPTHWTAARPKEARQVVSLIGPILGGRAEVTRARCALGSREALRMGAYGAAHGSDRA
jgi:hypothetical protein